MKTIKSRTVGTASWNVRSRTPASKSNTQKPKKEHTKEKRRKREAKTKKVKKNERHEGVFFFVAVVVAVLFPGRTCRSATRFPAFFVSFLFPSFHSRASSFYCFVSFLSSSREDAFSFCSFGFETSSCGRPKRNGERERERERERD